MTRRAPPDRILVQSFIDTLTHFVAVHAWLGYLVLFLAALLEAVPVVGSVIPGSTIILALSAMVPSGDLDLIGVLLAAALGAVIGDGSAFWAGHVYQRRILEAWPMSRYPGLIAQSEAFFKRFGTLAVFFGRFVPPIRAFVPVTAGSLGMTPTKFFAVNLPAVLVWAPAHVLPGVLAVTALHKYGGLPHHTGFGKHIWIPVVVAVAACIGIATWWWHRRKRAAEPTAGKPEGAQRLREADAGR
jgi:membrane protein DedA with SNARE-associated domain